MHAGGEDSVVRDEVELLEKNGNDVVVYSRDNNTIPGVAKIRLAGRTVWSRSAYAEVRRLLVDTKPDIMHVHNTFPLISPSVYWAASAENVPVIQTLHNFRLFCLNALFLKDGSPCELCLGKVPIAGVVGKCYRSSSSASAAVASMLSVHRSIGTYASKVKRYIALNEFCRNKFIEGGLPADRIVVKPNFVRQPPHHATGERTGLLYVGRLSEEKGIHTLSSAMKNLPSTRLRVAGTGPKEMLFQGMANTTLLGNLSRDSVFAEMVRAKLLVVPSTWYENAPRTIIEAYAVGLPVIASRIGALTELVEDGVTGILFKAGNADDLQQKIRWALAHPDALSRMGQQARARYEREFSPEVNYSLLRRIYTDAMEAHIQ